MSIEIYVDADGVLANFSGRIFDDPKSQQLRSHWFAGLKLYGFDHLAHASSDEVKKLFAGPQTDPSLIDLKKRWQVYQTYVYKLAEQPGFFRNLDVLPNAHDLLRLCHSLTGKLPNILTAPIEKDTHCSAEKKEWFEEHFAGLYGQFICQKTKEGFAKPNAILIDDRERYTVPWASSGGKAILYQSFAQAKKELTDLVLEIKLEPDLVSENKKVSYSAIVLDDRSHHRLINMFGATWENEPGWDTLAHHMTICMGPLPSDLESFLGREVEIEVTGFAGDEKVKAVSVRSPIKTKNKLPHVTLAVNRENGGKPVMSNNLANWRPVRIPLFLQGIVREL